MNINKNFTSTSGKQISINLTIDNGEISGTVINQHGTYNVKNIATVQGRKVLTLDAQPTTYQVLPDYIYNEIAQAVKTTWQTSRSQESIDLDAVEAAQTKYNTAFAAGDKAAIKLLDEWNALSAAYHQKYG